MSVFAKKGKRKTLQNASYSVSFEKNSPINKRKCGKLCLTRREI